jgi:hypothetical protein
MEVPKTSYASFITLAAFLTFGVGTAVYFDGEPIPAEQKDKDKDKKDMGGTKADDGKKKDEKKGMSGK